MIVLLLLGVAASLVPRYAKRRGRTLPAIITAQLQCMGDADLPNRTRVAMRVGRVPDPHYKLVDLEMSDGATFRHVWIIEDRWPTLSLRRKLARFKPQHVVAVRAHEPQDPLA